MYLVDGKILLVQGPRFRQFQNSTQRKMAGSH
jgi:hypothetical protein